MANFPSPNPFFSYFRRTSEGHLPSEVYAQWMDFARQMERWALIDKELCGLVNRLRATGYRHTLEVELRITRVGGDIGMYDFTELLAEFREKGVVTVIDAFRGNRVLHCSA